MYGKEFYIPVDACWTAFIFMVFHEKRHSCFWNFISSIPRTDNNDIYTSCSLSVSSSVLYTLYKLSAITSLRRSSFKLDRISIWTESDHRKTRVHKPRSDTCSFHYIKWIIFLKKKMHKSNVMLEYLAETMYAYMYL